MLKKQGQDTTEIQENVRKIGEEISQLETLESELNERQKDALLRIPNMPSEDTPVGTCDTDNPVIKNSW